MKNSQFIALLVCIALCFCLLSFSIVYASNNLSTAITTNGSVINDGLMMIYNALFQ